MRIVMGNTKKPARLVVFVGLLLLHSGAAIAASSVSQHGITWFFDRDYPIGQYANGDYWVQGPVHVTSIIPASENSGGWIKNGTQVNPEVSERQGYDSSPAYTTYDSTKNVSPNTTGRALYVAEGSIVSTVSKSTPNNRPQLKTAAILTVVSVAPESGSFRPAPVGSDKASVGKESDLDYSILKSLPPVAGTPPLSVVKKYFEKPWIEQNSNWTGRYIHPSDNQPDYGREISNRLAEGLLSLHLSYRNTEKRQLFIRLVQYGIDVYGAAKNGAVWEDLGGHNQGRKMPLLLAGLALKNADIIQHADAERHFVFQEDRQIWYVTQSDVGRVLYTADGRPREKYVQADVGVAEWGEQHARNPTRDGRNWNATYRDIAGSSTFGQVLAAHLTRGAVSAWNRQAVFDYYDRFWTIEQSSVGDTNSIKPFMGAMWTAYRDLDNGAYPGDPKNPLVGSDSPASGSDVVDGWKNITLASVDGRFAVLFNITPSSGGGDVVVGLSPHAAFEVTDLGPILRLTPAGIFDALNGDEYQSVSTVRYFGGGTYNVEMVIDPVNRRYSVRIATPQGASHVVAEDFDFRSEQLNVEFLANLGLYASTGGSYTVSDVRVVDVDSRPSPPVLLSAE